MINNYILGLFATDGCLQIHTSKSGTNAYYVRIEMKDKQIIEELGVFFDKEIKHRERIIKGKEREFYSIFIRNDEYGVLLKDKRQLIHYFKNLSKIEQSNFIRGCFDGDGGICRRKECNGYRAYLCANSKDGLDKIYEEFFSLENIRFSKYYDARGAGVYNYNIGKQIEVKKFLDIIYQDSNMKLQRKYEIYKQMVSIS